ncbi:MAG: hypothetical protein ACI837_001711 [Crocinitomicaceae bacterium]
MTEKIVVPTCGNFDIATFLSKNSKESAEESSWLNSS